MTKKLNVSDFHLKFGIDGGGGFLKICLSIQTNVNQSHNKNLRQKNEYGIYAKKFKDSGVNKLLILALAPNSLENYKNVQFESALSINQLRGTMTTDLKLTNILVDIMSHSCIYPCTWVHCKK